MFSEYFNGYWKLIHRVTYLHRRGKINRRETNLTITKTIDSLTCAYCKKHARIHQKKSSLVKDLFIFWWSVHNQINRENNKEEMGLEEAISISRLPATERDYPGLIEMRKVVGRNSVLIIDQLMKYA